MTNTVALLGWGSLLWEGGRKFDAYHGPWLNDGPLLRIEFSRVSDSRCGALTLVIDPENGIPTRVAYCLSLRSNITDVIEDLRDREGASTQNIGFVCRGEDAKFRDRASRDAVIAWAAHSGMDSVVWTDLSSNFAERLGRPFSVAAALEYLQTLEPVAKAKALEYIRRAPPFVQTPLRSALAQIS
jgi:hypothetical protein